jgi:hypothetical protein
MVSISELKKIDDEINAKRCAFEKEIEELTKKRYKTQR